MTSDESDKVESLVRAAKRASWLMESSGPPYWCTDDYEREWKSSHTSLDGSACRVAIMLKAEPVYAPGTWYPIDTAPRDGTLVDLSSIHGLRKPECQWSKNKGKHFAWCQFTFSHMNNRLEWMQIGADHMFTHWTPIPASPKDTK